MKSNSGYITCNAFSCFAKLKHQILLVLANSALGHTHFLLWFLSNSATGIF